METITEETSTILLDIPDDAASADGENDDASPLSAPPDVGDGPEELWEKSPEREDLEGRRRSKDEDLKERCSQGRRIVCLIGCLVLCAALLFLLVALYLFLPGIFGCVYRRVLCSMNIYFWRGTCNVDFDQCMARLPMGANQIPLGYLLLSRSSLPSSINLTGLPTGPSFDYKLIRDEGHQMPEKFFSGEWWRGNEHGGLVHNPYYWSEVEIWPMSIGMGISEQQHGALRKALEVIFAAPQDTGWIRAGLHQFFKERAEVGRLTTEDLHAWVHQVLMNTTFGRKVDFEYAKEFVRVQRDFLTYGTVSQLVPEKMYSTMGSFFKMPQTRDAIAAYVRSYVPLIEEKWAWKLKGQNCAPSKSCTTQLASMLLDSMLSTGGHFLPFGIRSGLSILYSNSSSNPTGGHTLIAGKELEFFWECLRFIPPVLGIPYWKARPDCARSPASAQIPILGKMVCPKLHKNNWTGYPRVNQWRGGHRYVLGVALGQLDPNVWGEGADSQFRVRALEEYERLSVGFAEMASNYQVDWGRSNRDCPAKRLALLLGQIFFQEFNVDAWEPVDANIPIDSQAAASLPLPQLTLNLRKGAKSLW